MTDLQKKIQKSSYAAAVAFYLIVIFPLGNLLTQLLILFQLLTGTHSPETVFRNQPAHVSLTTSAIFLICSCMVYFLASAALIMAQRIFRDINKEYTPFKPLHVTRLRRITWMSTLCILGDGLLDTWSVQLLQQPLQPGFIRMFLRDLNFAYFLLPLVVYCFSFILDYACQLQAEADTTL